MKRQTLDKHLDTQVDKQVDKHLDTEVDTHLDAAFAALAKPRETGFATTRRILPAKRAFDAQNARQRALRRQLVRPENAAAILAALPTAEGERMHAITPGDFIFCDLITAICRTRRPLALYIATLSLSKRNADTLAEQVRAGHPTNLTVLVSNYFEKTNVPIFAHLAKIAAETPGFVVITARSHCKLGLFDFGERGKLVIETSANLRSSDNIEQLSAIMDAALFDFHREWIAELAAK